MDFEIRKYIIENSKNDSIEQLVSSLNEVIPTKNELSLPGFGVYFEMLWQELGEKEKYDIIEKIKRRLK